MVIHDLFVTNDVTNRDAVKTPRKMPKRPDTSPLVEIYAEWERRAKDALMAHWQTRAQRLVIQIDMLSRKAVSDINKNKEWWDEWRLGYLGLLIPLVGNAADIGADAGAELLELTWALGVDGDLYNPVVADWARRHAGQLARWLTKTDRAMLRRHLSAWVDANEDFPALVTRINSFLNNPTRARRIAVTEATAAYAEGNLISWRSSEVVTGKTWQTANDEAVCPICGELHGQLAELDGDQWMHRRKVDLSVGLSVPAPPAHPL